MPTYTGTPLESEWDKLQKRRQIYDALAKKSLSPYKGTEMVTGRAVPYSWGTGAGKLGSAIFAALGNKKTAEDEKALNETYTSEQKKSLDRVVAAMSGTPETEYKLSPDEQFEGEQISGLKTAGVAPDPQRAALMMAGDPYLQNNDVAKAMINSQAYGGRGYRPRTSIFPGETGYSRVPHEGGPATYHDWPKQGFTPRLSDVDLAGRKGFAQQTGKNVAQMDPGSGIGAQAASEALAEREAEKKIDKPKVEASLGAQEKKTSQITDAIDRAKSQSSFWTTGFIGSALSNVPQTPAYNLSQTLEEVKSNIGFDKLQQMRDNSPTGGALGQVSEFENRLLQRVWGSLEQAQGKEQFEQALERVRVQVQESWGRIASAYEKDYGVPYKADGETGTMFDDPDKQKRYEEWKARK